MFAAQIILNSLVFGTQVLLLALSLYLVHSVSKTFHLALGAIGVVAAYVLYFALKQGLPLSIGIVLAVLTAIILGLISFYLLEPYVQKGEDMLGLLVSFAMLLILESSMSIIFGSGGKSFVDGVLPVFNFGELFLTVSGTATIALGILVALVAIFFVLKTPWGRIMRGVSENSALIGSLMTNPARIRMAVFIIASLISSFIMILVSVNNALTPRASFNHIIIAFIALLMGGTKNVKGLIITSYLLITGTELIIGLWNPTSGVSASWQMTLVFIIAMVVLTLRPEGILGSKQRV